MNSRVDFHNLLLTIADNVYFQEPSNTAMKYPAITYSRKEIKKLQADNNTYGKRIAYTVTVMDRNPDSRIAEEISELQYCKYDRQFTTNGLNHIVFVIYY